MLQFCTASKQHTQHTHTDTYRQSLHTHTYRQSLHTHTHTDCPVAYTHIVQLFVAYFEAHAKKLSQAAAAAASLT